MMPSTLRAMRQRLAASLVLAGLAAAAPAMAAAACNAKISQFGPTAVLTYDPFAGTPSSVDMDVEFRNYGDAPCTLSVALASQTPGSQRVMSDGPDQLTYTVRLPGGAQFINDITAPLGTVVLPGGAGKRAHLTFTIEVPAGQIAPAASYFDLMTARAFDVSGSAIQIDQDRTATGVTLVPAKAQVNIAGASGAFGSSPFDLDTIDFGNLSVNEVRNAFVQVRATRPVLITVLSENSGVMLHQILKRHAPGVHYALKLDSQNVNLSAGVYFLLRSPPITLDGISYPLNIKIIGPVDGLAAGEYKDTLTINVIPR